MRLLLALVAACSMSKQNAEPGVNVSPDVNHAIHSHRGPPAKIDAVSLHLEVTDARTHVVGIKRVESLSRHCNETEWSKRTARRIVGHELYRWGSREPELEGDKNITIPAGQSQKWRLSAKLETFEVTQICNAFAFDVEMEIDGVRGNYVIPLDVQREAD